MPPLPPPPPPDDDDDDDGHQPRSAPPPPSPPAFTSAPIRTDGNDLARDDASDGNNTLDAEYWSRKAAEAETDRLAAARKHATLYLDTISRSHLDFDFEHVCSVSMSPLHVYACLVCGKFFQGRGPRSWASKHAVDEDHRVYLKLASDGGGEAGSVWILPEREQVTDPRSLAALADIRYLLNPSYSERQLARLDAPDLPPSRDLHGQLYTPGFVGLNNVGKTDYINVAIQALAHVKPLRDFFIRGRALPSSKETTYEGLSGPKTSPLVAQFSLLVRKLWSPKLFKPQVSPQEFLHAVDRSSHGKFRLGTGGDPSEFLGWLLNQLHTDLGGSRKKESIVSACFRGSLRVESQKVFVRSGVELEEETHQLDADGRADGGQRDEKNEVRFNIDQEVNINLSPFFFLTIDLPPLPVFRDDVESNIIPQVPLAQLIAKYDGVTFQEARGQIRRFKLTRLPPFLILHYRRFTTNNFIEERNRTIVNFPVRGLDLSPTIDHPAVDTVYDLVANITHDATPGTVRDNQVWRSQVHTRVDGQPVGKRKASPNSEAVEPDERWFQIQDLIVEETNRQMLFLGESYVQIWRRKDGEQEVGQIMRQQAEHRAKKHQAHNAENPKASTSNANASGSRPQ